MNSFAERLKSERERLGLSQDELAKKVDPKKGQSFISNFETSANKGTSWIVELAHALGVSAYWLKTGKGPRTVELSLTEREAMLLDDFRDLTEDQQTDMVMYAAAHAASNRIKLTLPLTELKATGTDPAPRR